MRCRGSLYVVLHTDELHVDARCTERKHDVAGAWIAILRPTNTTSIHEMHIADNAIPWQVRMSERDDIACLGPNGGCHLREEIVGPISGNIDGIEHLIAVQQG